MIKTLQRLDSMGYWINKVVRAMRKDVVLMVTKQIYGGAMPDGTAIRPLDKTYPVYSSMYEMYKKELGLYQGHVDLSLTGKFLKGFKINYEDDGFTVEASKDIREGKNLTETLRFRYGEFEGMNQANVGRLTKMIKNALIAELKKALA